MNRDECRLERPEELLLTADHRRWAKNAQRKYKRTIKYWLDFIDQQRGRCAFSRARLRFDRASGTPQTGGLGAHPLYATVDHTTPGSDDLGHEIVSYDLNDLKGHLPTDCFRDLQATPSWRRLMDEWRIQANTDPDDRAAFRRIRRGSVGTAG
jgi:hypothetical protein